MKVGQIVVYPVKSAGGTALMEAPVERMGIAGDRRFMVVDAAGDFITQREHPRLALVRPVIDGSDLRIGVPGEGEVTVPRLPADGAAVRVTVWGDQVDAIAPSASADRALSRCLGLPARLVFIPDGHARVVDQRYAAPGDRVGFADGFPLLLISEGSLAALNQRLDVPVPMDRFRPNVVVAGAAPFAEDRWRTVRVGPVAFEVVKPCARCVMPTVDQQTGETSREPLRTLATFRTIDGKVMFGQNLVHRGAGVIRVGDPVVVESAR